MPTRVVWTELSDQYGPKKKKRYRNCKINNESQRKRKKQKTCAKVFKSDSPDRKREKPSEKGQLYHFGVVIC